MVKWSEEMLLEAYTPREHLLFQSTLRMPRDVTKAQREQRVDACIKMFLGPVEAMGWKVGDLNMSQLQTLDQGKTGGMISESEICRFADFGVQDALTTIIFRQNRGWAWSCSAARLFGTPGCLHFSQIFPPQMEHFPPHFRQMDGLRIFHLHLPSFHQGSVSTAS